MTVQSEKKNPCLGRLPSRKPLLSKLMCWDFSSFILTQSFWVKTTLVQTAPKSRCFPIMTFYIESNTTYHQKYIRLTCMYVICMTVTEWWLDICCNHKNWAPCIKLRMNLSVFEPKFAKNTSQQATWNNVVWQGLSYQLSSIVMENWWFGLVV